MTWQKLRLPSAVLLILLSVNACATNSGVNECLIFAPIYSAPELDTPETQAQIEVHNAKGEAVCGW